MTIYARFNIAILLVFDHIWDGAESYQLIGFAECIHELGCAHHTASQWDVQTNFKVSFWGPGSFPVRINFT